jgi:hypothetical protein
MCPVVMYERKTRWRKKMRSRIIRWRRKSKRRKVEK